MTLIITFGLEEDIEFSVLFHKRILEVRYIWKSGITLFSRHISSKVMFSSASNMLINYYANKKVSQVAVVVTRLDFLQYYYRFRINEKTLYSHTFQITYMLHKAGYWNGGVLPMGLIDNKSAFVQGMGCHRTGAEPLPEPMLN